MGVGLLFEGLDLVLHAPVPQFTFSGHSLSLAVSRILYSLSQETGLSSTSAFCCLLLFQHDILLQTQFIFTPFLNFVRFSLFSTTGPHPVHFLFQLASVLYNHRIAHIDKHRHISIPIVPIPTTTFLLFFVFLPSWRQFHDQAFI